jgi:hypothetical protein
MARALGFRVEARGKDEAILSKRASFAGPRTRIKATGGCVTWGDAKRI